MSFGFDDSLNMQTSVALAEEFVYRNGYNPTELFGFTVSTNGPIQYVMAGAIKLFGIQSARVIVLNLLFLFFLGGLFFASPVALAMCCALLFLWPTFLYSSAHFLGEVSAVAFCLWAVGFIERWKTNGKRANLVWAGLFFGAAISTKLLTVFLVPVLVFILFWEKRRLIKHYPEAVGCVLIALATFVFGYYLSIFHSFLFSHWSGAGITADTPIWRGLIFFIKEHFWAHSTAAGVPHRFFEAFYLSPWLGVLLLGTAPFAIYKNRAVVVIWAMAVGLILFSKLNERRLLPFLFFLPFFAFFYLPKWWEDLKSRSRLGLDVYMAVGVFAVFLAAFSVSVWRSWGLVRSVYVTAQIIDPVIPERNFHEQFGLLDKFVQSSPYPIITDGWWQFPQLSLFSGVNFYDRMRGENYSTLLAAEKVYLLFRVGLGPDWPRIKNSVCSKIVYEVNIHTLCEFNRKLPFDWKSSDL